MKELIKFFYILPNYFIIYHRLATIPAFKRGVINIRENKNLKGKSDNGNHLYLHYKNDSSNLSFSN